MACGLVPITSPETAEVFDDGISGFKVAYRDVENLHRYIMMLKDSPETRRYMAAQARKKAESQPWSMTKEQFKTIMKEKMEVWHAQD
jgi:glycosyltransferase involved in cell wall biosynthesis